VVEALDPVSLGGVAAGADVAQLGAGGDEPGEVGGLVARPVEFLSAIKAYEAIASWLDGPVDGALCDSLFRRLVRRFAVVVRRRRRTSALMV
jgi:hypothetical protein